MVRTLNVTLDDADFEKVEDVKEKLELTWGEFVIRASDALREREDLD